MAGETLVEASSDLWQDLGELDAVNLDELERSVSHSRIGRGATTVLPDSPTSRKGNNHSRAQASTSRASNAAGSSSNGLTTSRWWADGVLTPPELAGQVRESKVKRAPTPAERRRQALAEKLFPSSEEATENTKNARANMAGPSRPALQEFEHAELNAAAGPSRRASAPRPNEDELKQRRRRSSSLFDEFEPPEQDLVPPKPAPAPPSKGKGKARAIDPPADEDSSKPTSKTAKKEPWGKITKDRHTLTQMFPTKRGAPRAAAAGAGKSTRGPGRRKGKAGGANEAYDADTSRLFEGIDFDDDDLALTQAGPAQAEGSRSRNAREVTPPIDSRTLKIPLGLPPAELIEWMAQWSRPSGRHKVLSEFTPKELEEYEPIMQIARAMDGASSSQDSNTGAAAGPSKGRKKKGKKWGDEKTAKKRAPSKAAQKARNNMFWMKRGGRGGGSGGGGPWMRQGPGA